MMIHYLTAEMQRADAEMVELAIAAMLGEAARRGYVVVGECKMDPISTEVLRKVLAEIAARAKATFERGWTVEVRL